MADGSTHRSRPRLTSPRLPAGELPDLGLETTFLADLGKEHDRVLQLVHRLVRTPGLPQQVGEVVAERRFAVAVTLDHAELERGGVSSIARSGSPDARTAKREVVERRRLRPTVTCGACDRRSELEVLDRLRRVAAAAGEHPEDVVCLRDGACVVDLSCERERARRELECPLLVSEPVGSERPVGSGEGTTDGLEPVARRSEGCLGELPLAPAQVKEADPPFDLGHDIRRGERGSGLVARKGGAVVSGERLEIADRLVQTGSIRRSEGERGAVVAERLGVREKPPGMITRDAVALGRGLVVPGGGEMVGDERRTLVALAAACRDRPQRGDGGGADGRASSAR